MKNLLKKSLKKLLVTTAVSFIFLNASIATYGATTLVYDGKSHNYTASPIHLYVNDNEVTGLPMEPVVIEGRTLVPAREVFEKLGATVTYEPINKEVDITYNGRQISITINKNDLTIDGKKVTMEVPPKIINEKTMIPVRAVSENLGLDVQWDNSSRTVGISDPEPLPTDEPVLIDEHNNDPIIDPNNSEALISPSPDQLPPDNNGGNMYIPTPTPSTIPTSLVTDVSIGDIGSMNLPVTTINSITRSTVDDSIFINSGSPISSVDKLLLPDGRLVIDITNSNNMAQSDSGVINSVFYSEIRSAQNQVTPIPVTRIVIQIKDGVAFNLSLSQDRKTINVKFGSSTSQLPEYPDYTPLPTEPINTPLPTFEPFPTPMPTFEPTSTPMPTIPTTMNNINNIQFSPSINGDILQLVGDSAPDVVTSFSYGVSGTGFLKVSVPYANMNKLINANVNGVYATGILSSQMLNNTGQVIVSLSKTANIVSITKVGNITTIIIGEGSSELVSYDNTDDSIVIKKSIGITKESVTLNEDHIIDKVITISLNGNYSSNFSQDVVPVNSSNIVSYRAINNVNNMTDIVVNLNTWGTFLVTDTGDAIKLTFKNPREIYSKVVVIDPGHGGSDPGAIGFGLKEKDLNLIVAHKLKDLLDRDGRIKVYMTRNDDVFVGLEIRGEYATAMSDFMLSVHTNAVDNPNPSGVESLWYPHDNDTTIGIASIDAATILQNALVKNLGSIDRGVKKSALIIFKNSSVPSILGEMGFITNANEAALLGQDYYRDKIVQGFYEGINNIFDAYIPKR